MSINEKSLHIEQLRSMQFSKDNKEVWSRLEKIISSYAEDISQADGSDDTKTGCTSWWESCCDLLANQQVSIKHIQYDGHDEYIELHNAGPMIIDLSGWRINAGNVGQDMVFPDGSVFYPQQTVRVYTEDKGDFSFNRSEAIWNNKGDVGFLYDKGGSLVCSYRYGNKCHDCAVISDVFYDGKEKRSEGDEFVEIVNVSNSWIGIADWSLNANSGQTFTFPQGSKLHPRQKIRVYTNRIDAKTGGYSFDSHKAIWNNKGDTARLIDNNQKEVSIYSY